MEGELAMRGGAMRDVGGANNFRVTTFAVRVGMQSVMFGFVLIMCTWGTGALTADAFPVEEGSGAGQFEEPRGIAVSELSGDIFIADRNNQRVERFAGEAGFQLAWGAGVADGTSNAPQTCTVTCFAGLEDSGAGEFSSPEGVAVDSSLLGSSDVYVVDRGNHRVEKFTPAGTFILTFGGEVNETKDLTPGATEEEKNICTAASGDVCTAGTEGTGKGQFERSLGSVAVGTDGTVYVGDVERVQKFSPAGAYSGQLTLSGAGDVTAVAVDAANDVYVKSSEVSGVRKFDESGIELGPARDATGEPSAITVGPADELFVSDGPNLAVHHIFEYGSSGTLVATFDAGGEDGFRGIAYSNTLGVIYVLNSNAIRPVTPPPPGPLVVSQSSESVEPTSATLNATVDPEGAPTEYHFEYGTTTAYGQSTPIPAPLDAVNEVQSVSVVATGGGFTLAFKGETSAEIPFNAAAAEVQAALEGIPSLGVGQVAVSGEPGGPWAVEFTGSRAGEDVPELSADSENLTGAEPSASVATTTPGISLFDDRAVSAALTNLTPSTLYHFRVVATNGTQTADGPAQTFTTLPPVVIDGESATQVSSNSARLGAELNPLGVATEYHFEYGLSTSYEDSAPIPDAGAGSGRGDVAVALQLQGLSPNTTYHYRVVAHNSLGVVDGEDRTFTTQGEVSSVLPDGRAWEMVSPPNKEGVSLEAIAREGAVIQTSEDGSKMTYVAKAATEAGSPGNRSIENTQVLSTREAEGWESKDISTPHEAIAILFAGFPSEYKLFAGDLSTGIVEPQGTTPLSPRTSERTPYLRKNGNQAQACLTPIFCYEPLVSACPSPGQLCPPGVKEGANAPPGTVFGGVEEPPLHGGKFKEGVRFVSASPDLTRIVLTSPENLTVGYEGAGTANLFEWSDGTLRPVSVLPNGEAHGAEVGNQQETNMRGAVSAEGDRVVFTAGGHLYVRDMTLGQTVQADRREGGTGGGSQNIEFQGADRDGSKIFFTDDARLTSDATAKPTQPDLYECEVSVTGGTLSCTLHDLTTDAILGQAANVQGEVAAFSEDGRFVYFAANGVLAAGASPGHCGEESESATCNLYVRDTITGQTRLVAELSGSDAPDWDRHDSGLVNLTSRSSPNGRYLAFMSERSLTGYDNRDADGSQRDEEVFLYDSATGKTMCVSCNPSGARPQGVFDPDKFPGLLVDRPRTWGARWLAGSVPGWTPYDIAHSLYQSRYLSDSGRMFFNSPDALVPQDANGKEDVYQYEPIDVGDCARADGCVSLISSGTSSEESAFMDASADGSSAFFLTAAKLSATDVDSDFDIYDAHICSTGSPCVSQATSVPPPCITADSCRPAPTPQPEIFGPQSSATFSGSGNPAAPVAKPVVKPKPPTRAQLLSKALKACAKKAKKKRAACRAQAQRRYGAKKASAKKAKKSGKDAKSSRNAVYSSAAEGRGQ
jgi:hypothetical protein